MWTFCYDKSIADSNSFSFANEGLGVGHRLPPSPTLELGLFVMQIHTMLGILQQDPDSTKVAVSLAFDLYVQSVPNHLAGFCSVELNLRRNFVSMEIPYFDPKEFS